MLRAIFSLPRTVWLISLLSDSASAMVYPLASLYLASVLMAGPRALGLIEGIAEATASLLKLIVGVIVDRTRRAKPWVVAFSYGCWPCSCSVRCTRRPGHWRPPASLPPAPSRARCC